MPKNKQLYDAIVAMRPNETNVMGGIKILRALYSAETADDFREHAYKYAKFLNFNIADVNLDYKGNENFLASKLDEDAEKFYQIRLLQTDIVWRKLNEFEQFKTKEIREHIDNVSDIHVGSLAIQADEELNNSKKIEQESINAVNAAKRIATEQVDLARKKYSEANSEIGPILPSRRRHNEAVTRTLDILKTRLVTQAQVEAAVRLVIEEVERAKTEAQRAIDLAEITTKAYNNTTKPGISLDERIKYSDEAHQAFQNLNTALQNSKDAQIKAEQYKKIALDPNNPYLKELKTTLLIEKYATLGFEETLVRRGQKTPESQTAEEHLKVIAGKSTVFEGVHLNEGDTIHSTLKFPSGAEMRLIQDAQGFITDDSSNLTDEEKEQTAIIMAKKALLNYKPEDGPIIMSGGDPEQAERFYAALLVLSENNPHLNIKRSDIISEVAGFSPPGTFTSNKTFISTHLPHLNTKVLELEKESLVIQQDDFKQRFQELDRGVEDLPETVQFPGRKP